LAMEQYVLNGGNLLMFQEPNDSSLPNDDVLENFLNNFGIKIVTGNILKSYINSDVLDLGAALPAPESYLKGVRSVLVNSVGKMELVSDKDYTVIPILYFDSYVVGAMSSGYFVSDFLELSAKIDEIEPGSVRSGKVFFFYDTDMLKNDIFVSDESPGHSFYEIVPFADNLLFFLRLIDYATAENIEQRLPYRHYTINVSSIGNSLFNGVNERYTDILKDLQDKISKYEAKQLHLQDTLNQQGFASVKNIGDISNIAQVLDETKDDLNRTKAHIAEEAQTIVVGLTFLIVFIVPCLLLIMMAAVIALFKKYKSRKIRRLINNA